MKRLLFLLLLHSALFAAKREPVYLPTAIAVRPHTLEAPAEPTVTLEAPLNYSHDDGVRARIGTVVDLRGVSVTDVTSRVFRSPGAVRVRLCLQRVALTSPDAVLRVVGRDGEGIPFGIELRGPSGEIWTPSVAGDTIEIRGEGVYEITALAHIGDATTNSDACFTDVSCHTFSDRDALSKSIAALEFVSGSSVYTCTGGLINGAVGDRQLLTANHCISTVSEAASLEALWDSRSTSCGASAAVGTRTNGATLLVTSSSADVTLLRMNSLPAGRYLMGWDTAAPPAGTQLYRISHPAVTNDPLGRVYAQAYSLTSVNTTSSTCAGAPRPAFIYSTRTLGGVGPGSSGAPVIIQGGYIVGQLLGGCGQGTVDGCSSLTYAMDGALARSYAALQQFIDPDAGTCTPTTTTMCLNNDRFAVSATYSTGTSSGQASAIKLTADSGYLTFFSASNIEVVIKVLEACGLNARYWVFAGGLTNVNTVITVRDTKSGTVKTYTNPTNTPFQPIQDTNALAVCP